MLCDSHAHLESARFDADREQVITRARQAGVGWIISCGSDLTTSEAEVALAARYPGVWAAVGVHAHRASTVAAQADGVWRMDVASVARVRELALSPRVVAIGETGLDYHYDFSERGAQRAVLAQQLALAVELDLPVILHNRESDADLRAVVDAAPPGLRGVLHCFLAGEALAEWALACGLYLGVAGPITFASASHLLEILRRAPIERLLVETDCPYLAPHPLRGRRNEPAWVTHVAARLAEVLTLPPEEVARQTTANAARLFGLDDHAH